METLQGQDLDPRAYVWIPVRVTFVGIGVGYTYGGVVTDATLPVKDVDAKLTTLSIGGGYTFSMFGKTAQVSATLPFAWAKVTGLINENARSITRTGFSDMRLRLSVLFLGAPASTPAQLAKAPRRTILGTSISIIAPTGQYLYGKLINLGTNRWAFKPELALSQPIGNKWLFDVYAGIWFFTNNNSFYPGQSVRAQDPMGTFQGHLSYNFTNRLWAALNLTYYIGGNSSVDGISKQDRAENSRIGGTVMLPLGKRQSIKIAYSTGAIIRFGANFSTISVGWQTFFMGKPKKQ
jgi:hypothetical protein